MNRLVTLLVLACAIQPCGATPPCAAVSSQILEDVGYQEQDQTVLAEFGRCLSTRNVCALTQSFDGDGDKVIASDATSTLPGDGEGRSSLALTTQTPSSGNCYLAVFSGGSAAAWLITGWTVKGGKVRDIHGLEKYAPTGERITSHALIRDIRNARARAARDANR